MRFLPEVRHLIPMLPMTALLILSLTLMDRAYNLNATCGPKQPQTNKNYPNTQRNKIDFSEDYSLSCSLQPHKRKITILAVRDNRKKTKKIQLSNDISHGPQVPRQLVARFSMTTTSQNIQKKYGGHHCLSANNPNMTRPACAN